MSPEQIRSSKTARKPADVFSVGATLYALLGGDPPFKGESTMEVLIATIQNPHQNIKTLRADVSEATAELIQRCLQKEPEKRYVDGAALREALKVCRATLHDSKVRNQAIMQLTTLQKSVEIGKPVPSPTPTPPRMALPPNITGIEKPRGANPSPAMLPVSPKADPAPVIPPRAVQAAIRRLPVLADIQRRRFQIKRRHSFKVIPAGPMGLRVIRKFLKNAANR